MLRKRHSSRGQLLSQLSDPLPGQIIFHCGAFTGSLVQPPREAAGQQVSQPASQPASQSAGRHLLVLTTKKNFLSSPPTTPGTTPTNMQTLESRERSNGRSCHTLFHVVLKQTATSAPPPQHPTKPLISPADPRPLEGSDWTACRAAQPPCLPFVPLCNITRLQGAFCIVE